MCLEPYGLSVTEAAAGLGVSRQALNNLVNGKAAMSPEMAVRLEKRFGGSAEMWLSLQLAFDLAAAYKHASAIRVKPLKAGARVPAAAPAAPRMRSVRSPGIEITSDGFLPPGELLTGRPMDPADADDYENFQRAYGRVRQVPVGRPYPHRLDMPNPDPDQHMSDAEEDAIVAERSAHYGDGGTRVDGPEALQATEVEGVAHTNPWAAYDVALDALAQTATPAPADEMSEETLAALAMREVKAHRHEKRATMGEAEEDAIVARIVGERSAHYGDGGTRVEGPEAVQAYLGALKTLGAEPEPRAEPEVPPPPTREDL